MAVPHLGLHSRLPGKDTPIDAEAQGLSQGALLPFASEGVESEEDDDQRPQDPEDRGRGRRLKR